MSRVDLLHSHLSQPPLPTKCVTRCAASGCLTENGISIRRTSGRFYDNPRRSKGEGGGGRTGISGGFAGDGKESSAVSGGDCGGSCRVVVARDAGRSIRRTPPAPATGPHKMRRIVWLRTEDAKALVPPFHSGFSVNLSKSSYGGRCKCACITRFRREESTKYARAA